MCIINNFYEDLIFDLEYQEWLREQQLRANAEYEYEMHIIQKSYDIMAEQYFKDLEQYETSKLQKEYREIKEWEDLQTA